MVDEEKDVDMAVAETGNGKKRKIEDGKDAKGKDDPETAVKRNKCEDVEKIDPSKSSSESAAGADATTEQLKENFKSEEIKSVSLTNHVNPGIGMGAIGGGAAAFQPGDSINLVEATFDDSKWDWIERFPEARVGLKTFIGPYLHKENSAVDLVGEVEARSMWEVMTSLHKAGYICPSIAIPKGFDPLADADYFNDADAARLKSLPLGIAYLMLRDDPEKQVTIHDCDGIVCGQISNFGVPPSYTWMRIRCTSQSNLAKEIGDILSNDVTRNSNFAFAGFDHTKTDITDRDYLLTENIFAEEKDLRLYVETGDIQNALATMFTVQKGQDTVAKSLVTYRNLSMMTGGPNIVQLDVAKEWQNRGLWDWLLSCIEDFFVSKFRGVLGEHSDLLKMTAGNAEIRVRDKDGELRPDFYSAMGYTGSRTTRSKSLVFKMIQHGLKTSLDEITNRKFAVAYPAQTQLHHRPKDPRLNFVSSRAEALVDAVVDAIPDKVLPGIAKALTRAAMEPSIPDINKPPALFLSPRDLHTAAVSDAMAEAIVEALPKDRSVSSSDNNKDQGNNPAIVGQTEMDGEVSDAIIKGLVDKIPDKHALAQAVVGSAPDLDLPDGTVAAAQSLVDAGNASEIKKKEKTTGNKEDTSIPVVKSNIEHRRSKTATETLIDNVTDSIAGAPAGQEVSNLAPQYEDKEIDDVKVSAATSAGMGLSGVIAKVVTDTIPDRIIPEVAVALTQAVAQYTSKDEVNSQFSVPTTMKRGPGALANSVLNVVPDRTVPEVAVALTEAAMDAIQTQNLSGQSLKWVAPSGVEPSESLATTVLQSIPAELLSQVAVALTQAVIDKIPEKDPSVMSEDSVGEPKLQEQEQEKAI